MNSDILERYKKMQERFNLPQLKELKDTFKFEIENEDGIFDQIRNGISDRLFAFTEKIIEPIIAGSDSFCCLFEENMLTDNERNDLFRLYKKIQVLKWENNLLLTHPNDKETMKWIRKAWNFWNSELEDKIIKICKKFSVGWECLEIENKETTYHG
jgi:hypothetical protein